MAWASERKLLGRSTLMHECVLRALHYSNHCNAALVQLSRKPHATTLRGLCRVLLVTESLNNALRNCAQKCKGNTFFVMRINNNSLGKH